MIEIGEYNNRQIFYTNVRSDVNWFDKLPSSNWLAFTIADLQDKELLDELSIKCLDKNVSYVCSVGQLASETDDYFDLEFVERQVQLEIKTGKPQDYEGSPMTVFFKPIDEGFWYALVAAYATAYDKDIPIDKVICIDLTQQGVMKYLQILINKIKNDWIPSDDETEIL